MLTQPSSAKDSAILANNAPIPAATGNIPYAAATFREFAVVSFDLGTRLGTTASLAGDHSIVQSSKTNDAATSPAKLSTNGNENKTKARVASQTSITRFLLSRSTNTPAGVDNNKPGATRVMSTREIAAPPELPPSRSAKETVAKSPSQSPVAEMSCAIQSLKNSLEPKIASMRLSLAVLNASPMRVALLEGLCWSTARGYA